MEGVISIITPAYNAGKVIDRAVDAIVPQMDSNVEWVIVDDGSTDGSGAYLDKIAAVHPRIRIIHTPNRGAGAARNTGIHEAHGEWIAFLDADDYFTDTAIADIRTLIVAPRAREVDIFYLPKIMTDMEGADARVVQPESAIKDGLPELEFWSSLYRTEYLKRADVRFPEHREQDVETAFRMLAFNRTNRIRTQHEPAFLAHRDNPNSNVHTWDPERLLRVKSVVYADLLGKLPNVPANVRKKIVSTLYTSVDQYLIETARRRISSDSVHLQTVLRLGRAHLGAPCTVRTWVKKALFVALSLITPFVGRRR